MGYVTRPEVMAPGAPLSALDELATRRGFTSVCVCEGGAVGGKLLGRGCHSFTSLLNLSRFGQ